MFAKNHRSPKECKTIPAKSQAPSVIFSKAEEEAICRNGVIGLEGVWDLYDMWI
jgi:hypothetical protein